MTYRISHAIVLAMACSIAASAEINLGQWSTTAGASDLVNRGTVNVSLSIGSGCPYGSTRTTFGS